ncbi:MAG: hypothetical protein LBC75_02525 [Fibromonadaceae bacterium]|jgi:hypothetical protein|nr:hypothetical protein [Fibromonadaceae bacterium]
MNIDSRLTDDFTRLCKPVSDWLNIHFSPHTKITIEAGRAEITEGLLNSYFKTGGDE